MSKQVRVNLFEVNRTEGKTQPLSDTLREYSAMRIADRWRGDIRLDLVDYRPANASIGVDAFHLEFSKSRVIGPGRMGSATPLQDISLAADELFGEETTALYIPSKTWLLVLNNHYGVGPSRMAGYFNALDATNSARYFDYTVEPMIDRGTLSKLKKMRRFAEIEISARVGVFVDSDDPVAESVLEAASQAHAARISFRMMANEKHKRGNSLTPSAVMAFVNKMLPNSENIDRLVVKADDETAEAKDKFVDLLKHKVSVPFSVQDLDISGGRYTPQSKISMLQRACRGWLEKIG